MKVCKIVSIKPDGKSFETQHGTLYPFYVVMEDGGAGTANSKSDSPPYKAGDTVGYEITGASPRGVPKLKITRNPKPGEGTYTGPGDSNPDLEAASHPTSVPQQRPAPSHAQTPASPKSEGNGVHGATACWAVGKAVEMVIAGKETDVEATARTLLAIQQRIERGDDSTIPF